MIRLPDRWAPILNAQPETGLGYTVVSIVTHAGQRFDQVVIVGGYVSKVRGYSGIPFAPDEIAKIVVTHAKWDWRNDEKS